MPIDDIFRETLIEYYKCVLKINMLCLVFWLKKIENKNFVVVIMLEKMFCIIRINESIKQLNFFQ